MNTPSNISRAKELTKRLVSQVTPYEILLAKAKRDFLLADLKVLLQEEPNQGSQS